MLAAVTLLSAQGCAPDAPADAATQASHSVSLAAAGTSTRTTSRPATRPRSKGTRRRRFRSSHPRNGRRSSPSTRPWPRRATPVPRYTYGTPVFYVPALSGFPQWFVVAVPRSTVSGGQPGPAVSTLMLFARDKKTVNWTLSGTAVLSQPLPKIALDGGYAIPVSTVDQSLLLRPDVAGATQAAVVDDGPSSPAAAVVGAGPQTTGLYASQAAQAAAQQRKGLQYRVAAAGVALPAGRAAAGRRRRARPLRHVPEHHQRAPQPGGRVAHPGARRRRPDPDDARSGRVPRGVRQLGVPVRRDRPPATARGAKLQIIGWQSGPSYGHAY